MAPKNTPAEMIGWLNRPINASLAQPTIARGLPLGTPIPMAPEAFAFLAAETEKWANVIRAANI